MTRIRQILLPILSIISSSLAFAFTPSADGLYAVFTTSMGEFTARLEMEKAPYTVANFVGLAEGSRTWFDTPSLEVRNEPFYNGLTFHRVIAGFVIQGGSPNGKGTDGPGYAFPDEINPSLTHDSAGYLSMANSGFNSNGSQFFVTLAATSWLDNKHAIFGKIIEGMETVNLIANVPVDDSEKPIDPVIIESIAIVRTGAAALQFDVSEYGLPRVQLTKPTIELSNLDLGLLANQPENSIVNLYKSSNLKTWDSIPWTADNESQLSLPLEPSAAPQYFRTTTFYLAESTPKTGSKLILNFPNNVLTINFTEEDAGTATIDSEPSFPFSYYKWFPLSPSTVQVLTNLALVSGSDFSQYYLFFSNETEGEVHATFRRLSDSNIILTLTGTFSIEPLDQ